MSFFSWFTFKKIKIAVIVKTDDTLKRDDNISKKMSAISEKTDGIVNRIIDLEMQNFSDRFVAV